MCQLREELSQLEAQVAAVDAGAQAAIAEYRALKERLHKVRRARPQGRGPGEWGAPCLQELAQCRGSGGGQRATASCGGQAARGGRPPPAHPPLAPEGR